MSVKKRVENTARGAASGAIKPAAFITGIFPALAAAGAKPGSRGRAALEMLKELYGTRKGREAMTGLSIAGAGIGGTWGALKKTASPFIGGFGDELLKLSYVGNMVNGMATKHKVVAVRKEMLPGFVGAPEPRLKHNMVATTGSRG